MAMTPPLCCQHILMKRSIYCTMAYMAHSNMQQSMSPLKSLFIYSRHETEHIPLTTAFALKHLWKLQAVLSQSVPGFELSQSVLSEVCMSPSRWHVFPPVSYDEYDHSHIRCSSHRGFFSEDNYI